MLALERDARAAVEADLAAFGRLVADHLVDRGPTRGLAWFGSRELGLAEQIRLPLVLPDQGRVGWRPSLLAGGAGGGARSRPAGGGGGARARRPPAGGPGAARPRAPPPGRLPARRAGRAARAGGRRAGAHLRRRPGPGTPAAPQRRRRLPPCP